MFLATHSKLYKRLGISAAELKALCVRSPITELAFFGSILRSDFDAKSDIDILVRLAPECTWSLMDFVGFEYQLEDLFQRKVDLVDRDSVEKSHNWIRRREILNTAETIYTQSSDESRRVLSA